MFCRHSGNVDAVNEMVTRDAAFHIAPEEAKLNTVGVSTLSDAKTSKSLRRDFWGEKP